MTAKDDGPGREAVRKATRKLALAEGRKDTRDALLDLIRECQAWARVLAAPGERDA